jgi:hypothetical protein
MSLTSRVAISMGSMTAIFPLSDMMATTDTAVLASMDVSVHRPHVPSAILRNKLKIASATDLPVGTTSVARQRNGISIVHRVKRSNSPFKQQVHKHPASQSSRVMLYPRDQQSHWPIA